MRATTRLPAAFHSLKLLRALSIAAMGLSLAAATGGVFAHLLHASFAVLTALPTLLHGVAWGLLLRDRSLVGKSNVRWGWVASIPLAMANGALSGGLALAAEAHGSLLERFYGGAALGATFGAIFWIPGLIATLAFFGGPIAWAQRLAERGLAGEERGERLVGLASALLAIIGLGLAVALTSQPDESSTAFGMAGVVLLYGLSILAIAIGGAATGLATYRSSRRKQFVSDVEAGAIKGYRIDDGVEGKVLVRIASAGEGYRVADVEEEVAALDEAGEVVDKPLERRFL